MIDEVLMYVILKSREVTRFQSDIDMFNKMCTGETKLSGNWQRKD